MMKPTSGTTRRLPRMQGPGVPCSAAIVGFALLIGPANARAESPVRPTAIGGAVAVGYHDNILGSSTNEELAFRSGSPGYLFIVDRLDDTRSEVEIWGRWEFPSFYKKARIEVGYQRSEWIHTPILGQDRYRISVRQKLPRDLQFDLRVRHKPQVYLRHRLDKDAPPGLPAFRPESVRETEVQTTFSRAFGSMRASAAYLHSVEDRNQWFNERDERGDAALFGLKIPFAGAFTFSSEFLVARGRSRNEPDLGSDRSYREQGPSLGIAVDGGTDDSWQIAASGRLKWRRYTTDDAQDESRYRREDQISGVGLRASTAIGSVRPFAAIEWSGRRVDLPPGAGAADEDGEYESTWIRSGLEWEIH